MKEAKTYKSLDDVFLSGDDLVWVVTLDVDSFNYVPSQYRVSECVKEQHGFWYSQEKCINECEDLNSQ